MHQPYYTNLLTRESPSPWVRLHATKDYSDMVLILEKYPKIHQTINLVPSLIEQVEDYAAGRVMDAYQKVTLKKSSDWTHEDKDFIRNNFFKINPERVIVNHPRYYELYFKYKANAHFSDHDVIDLAVWFNLAWIDPMFRKSMPALKALVAKGRFYNDEDKETVIACQLDIIKNTIPVYKRFIESGQVEATITPYYHPILPLLYSTKTAIEANPRTPIPKHFTFSYPQDAKEQIDSAVRLYERCFGRKPEGMWPSEESVSEHILPYIIGSGVKWIVTDEAQLFKSINKRRSGSVLYQPYLVEREDGPLTILFRDRNLSDLIGFLYHRWSTVDAVNDFMFHMENIAKAYKDENCLVTIAMDGENAWEYYPNDGHDFLNALYERLSESKTIQTVTVSEYLKKFPAKKKLERVRAGSWIYGDFQKWIGNQYKNKAWEYINEARALLEKVKDEIPQESRALAWKQMYILEGSDWFWWYGDKAPEFDMLFRMHLSNFYRIIGREIPHHAQYPLEPA